MQRTITTIWPIDGSTAWPHPFGGHVANSSSTGLASMLDEVLAAMIAYNESQEAVETARREAAKLIEDAKLAGAKLTKPAIALASQRRVTVVEAVAAALRAKVKQRVIAEATGFSRETIRIMAREAGITADD